MKTLSAGLMSQAAGPRFVRADQKMCSTYNSGAQLRKLPDLRLLSEIMDVKIKFENLVRQSKLVAAALSRLP